MSRWSPVVPQVGTGNPNVKLASSAWGEHFIGHVRSNAAGDHVQPAGLLSTAPYKQPSHCKGEACRNTQLVRDTDYCIGHARSLGIVTNWSTKPGKPKQKVMLVSEYESAEDFREPGPEVVLNVLPLPDNEPDLPITEEVEIIFEDEPEEIPEVPKPQARGGRRTYRLPPIAELEAQE